MASKTAPPKFVAVAIAGSSDDGYDKSIASSDHKSGVASISPPTSPGHDAAKQRHRRDKQSQGTVATESSAVQKKDSHGGSKNASKSRNKTPHSLSPKRLARTLGFGKLRKQKSLEIVE